MNFLSLEKKGIQKFISRIPLSLPPFPEILELGCGTGIVTFAFLSRFKNAHIIATDINPKMLLITAREAYRRKIPPERIEFGEADINNPQEITFLDKENAIQIQPKSFHCIVASQITKHMDPELAFPVIFRLLKPNGYFLMINTSDNLYGKIYRMFSGSFSFQNESLFRMLTINEFENIQTIFPTRNEFPVNITKKAILAQRKKI